MVVSMPASGSDAACSAICLWRNIIRRHLGENCHQLSTDGVKTIYLVAANKPSFVCFQNQRTRLYLWTFYWTLSKTLSRDLLQKRLSFDTFYWLWQVFFSLLLSCLMSSQLCEHFKHVGKVGKWHIDVTCYFDKLSILSFNKCRLIIRHFIMQSEFSRYYLSAKEHVSS